MIKPKQFLFIYFAMMASVCASQTITQGVISVSTELTDLRDNPFSGTATMSWGERSTKEAKISRNGETTVISGSSADISIHDSLSVNYAMAGLAPTGFVSVRSDFSSVESGKKWSSEYTVTQSPASWCASSNDMTFSTTFKAGDKQLFEILIAGEKKTIDVIPIYERGYWKRCYSSKILRRVLYSKELNMVVSVESIMYSVSTGKPGSVFSFHFNELK